MFSNYVYKWLDSALDWGISEDRFWDMTIAELIRQIDSIKRIRQRELQEKAHFDYKLADLIGVSISRVYNSANTMPDISQVYPTIFDSEEVEAIKCRQQDELSALRFKQFASSFNQRYTKEEAK